MGAAAVVMGDQVTGQCAGHQIPGPVGSPIPGPPLPFAAPLLQGLASTVTIGGKPAAVKGSSGTNTPPHVGLHPSDSKFAPNLQEAQVVAGSSSVTFDGKAAAYSGCSVTACLAAAPRLTGSATTVTVAT